jgi:outer membrane lipoprotein-sorting protein
MKKRSFLMIIGISFVVLVTVGAQAFAEDMQDVMDNTTMMDKDITGKSCQGYEAMEMNHMKGIMMKDMMEKSLVATNDGGVIVLAGNTLTKYDKDLNLLKEVEVKMDMARMQKEMKEMMKNCPMINGAMMGSCIDKKESAQETQAAVRAGK